MKKLFPMLSKAKRIQLIVSLVLLIASAYALQATDKGVYTQGRVIGGYTEDEMHITQLMVAIDTGGERQYYTVEVPSRYLDKANAAQARRNYRGFYRSQVPDSLVHYTFDYAELY